jgi:hypothetical protein
VKWYATVDVYTCLHNTKETLVLNLHVFSLAGITDFTCY